MKKLISIAAVAILVLSLGAGSYWYFSPYLAMKSISAAAKAKDSDSFNDKVDYPRLRESLKGQLSAQMVKTVGEQSGNPFGALGAMLGMAMVNQMVDAFVRPEMVMEMMKEGQVKLDKSDASSGSSAESAPIWIIERKGTDRVVAIPQRGSDPMTGDEPGFVFERSGFATWKLTELRLTFPRK
jgi:hypothetical protein